MLHAVSYAFLDSINALLIGVIVAVGVMLPRGQYRRIVPLLVFGDWLGVFLLAFGVLHVFVGLQDTVRRIHDSPVFGLVFIALGVVTAIVTWRSKSSGSNALIDRILIPLRRPSAWTLLTGMVLGVTQSVTSLPFFGGIIIVATGDYSTVMKSLAMLWYASVALGLPTVVALLVGLVRAYPESRAGWTFLWMRQNSKLVAKVGGYIVAVLMTVLGFMSL